MKIGAGHKPQPYDGHGRYTGPGGGTGSSQTGPDSGMVMSTVPMSLQGDGQDGDAAPKGSAEEPDAQFEVIAKALEADRRQTEDGNKPLDGVLVADSGQIKSDAGGGNSNETQRLEEKKFTPERLVINAKADIGSDEWKPKEVNGKLQNQCNVYVASKLRQSGAHVPNVGGWSGALGEGASDAISKQTGGAYGGQIPSANDWHKGVPGYERVKTENGEKPMPGDVAASKEHVGIVSGAGKTVSVTSRGENAGHVVENDWGFREGQSDVTFWRHAGSHTMPTRTGS